MYGEIKDALEDQKDQSLDKQFIDSLTYLEACLKETLRIRTPITYHNRLCTKNVEECSSILGNVPSI